MVWNKIYDALNLCKNGAIALLKNPEIYYRLYQIYNIEKFHRTLYAKLSVDMVEAKALINFWYAQQTIMDTPMKIWERFIGTITPLGRLRTVYNVQRWYNVYVRGGSLPFFLWQELKENSYYACKDTAFILAYMTVRFPGMRNAVLDALKNLYFKPDIHA